MKRLFVGRHGRYDRDIGLLTDLGRGDGERMGEQLLSEGYGRNSIILASEVPRVLEMAGVVRGVIGAVRLVRSPFISKIGERPEPVKDVPRFLGDVMTACEVDHTDSDILVVTHLPLVRAVAGGEPVDGVAYPVPEGWENPKYVPGFEFILETPDRW